jgi:hypothetical protein
MARQPTERDQTGHQANVNQAQHEPVPASRQDERPQAAEQQNEDLQQHSEQRRRGAELDDRAPALGSLSTADQPGPPAPAPSGDAAGQLMGGPAPQGPVPGVQVAGVEITDGRVTRIRAVSNAVPGQPDGEVDTRS